MENKITQIVRGCLFSLPFSLSALAQGVSDANSALEEWPEGIEIIEVTAVKRVTQLQKTPVAISAFNSDELARQDIEDVADIQFAIPNAMFTDRGAFNIRGVGNSAISATSESGTGVHINGIYLTAPSTANEFYDLQAIEVLRGPQGTLYGRNTTAGVFNVITQKPTDILEGNITVEVANYDSLRTVGALNIPLSDTVFQRFAFNTVKRGGYTENIATGNDIDGRDQFSIRSTTLFEVNDELSAAVFAQYFKEDSDRANRRGVRCVADPVLGCSAQETGFEFVNSDFVDGNVKNFLAEVGIDSSLIQRPDFYNFDADGNRKVNPRDPRKVNVDTEPFGEADDLIVSVELNYETDTGVFTSLTAYHDRSSSGQRDFDNANGSDAYLIPVSYAFNDETFVENTTDFKPIQLADSASEQYSQELRFVSQLEAELNYTLGLYWLNYKAQSRVATYYPTLSIISQVLGLPIEFHDFDTRTPDIETNSWAVFGELYYDLSEQLKLTAGIRYSNEEKSQKTQTVTPFSFLAPGFDPTVFEELENDWKETTGKLGLSYIADIEVTDETLFFATLSRGYKAGGLNPGGAVKQTFDAEYINAFEIGTKNTLFNRRLQANATLFYYDYNGLQLGALELSATGAAITDNTDAEVKGAELEFVANPITGLFINLNLSLLDTEVTGDFLTPDLTQPSSAAIVDVRGNELPYAPDHSIQFGIQYAHPVSENWNLVYRAQTYWQDKFYARVYNTPTDEIDSWQQTDLFLTLRDSQEKLEFELFVKNVENNEAITGLSVATTLAGRFRLPAVLDPRTYGLRVHYRFD